MKSALDYVICAILFLFSTDVSGTITEAPLNAATEVGQQAIFNCTSDTIQQNWVLSAKREDLGTPSAQSIVLSCVVQPGFTTLYDVDRPGGNNNECNLIVKATTMQQAGVYTCSDSATGPSAILTVIDRDPTITVKNSSGVVAGDQVTMSYTVKYNTSTASSQTPTIQPVLTWTDSQGQTIPGSNTPGTNSVTSSISITSKRQAIQPYTCSISCKINGSTTMFATNTPNGVSAPPPTPTIDVLYAPIISSITMSEEVPVCPGKTVKITCQATASPEPTYSWIGPDSKTYSGATIDAVMNGVYNCTASNIISGSTHSDTSYTTLNVSEKNCTESDKTTPSDGLKCCHVCIVCIVIGACILGNVIATVVFLIYYNRNIGFKRTLNDRFLLLKKMLPCMNDGVACGCGWIFLSICVFGLVGMLFTICMVVIANCSRGRKSSENNVQHFHNPSDIRHSRKNDEIVIQNSSLGANGDDTYEELGDGIAYQGKNKKNKVQKKQPKGTKNGQPKSAIMDTNQSPSSLPPNPHSQQPTTAHGVVYSELPVTKGNIQPEQYIEGNKDNNYSELMKT